MANNTSVLGGVLQQDDPNALANLLAATQTQAPTVVSGGGALGTIQQAKLGSSTSQPTLPDVAAAHGLTLQTQDPVPMPEQSSILGTVGAPSSASLNSTDADNAQVATHNKTLADTPKPYDYSAHGKLGNIGHVLGRIGNIAGDILDPGATSLIPHSDLFNARRLAGDQAREQQALVNAQNAGKELDAVNNETANRAQSESHFQAEAPTRAAGVTEATSRTALQDQQTKDLQLNNQPLDEKSAPALTQVWQPALDALGIKTSPFHASQSAPDVAKNIDAIKTLWEAKQKADQATAFHKDHEEDVAATRDATEANREATRAASENKTDAATRKEVLTLYTPSLDAAKRLNVMSEAGDKAKAGDQQAGLAVLTNHLGMTAGGQKGMRITQAMMQEAQQSRPWLQGIKATWSGKGPDAYLTGVALTPTQVDQMVGLGRTQLRESVNESRHGSSYVAPGRTDDGPDRVPSTSTMHMYLKEAGGDVAKAKTAAKEDGWSIQ